jgi:hypothetical protein
VELVFCRSGRLRYHLPPRCRTYATFGAATAAVGSAQPLGDVMSNGVFGWIRESVRKSVLLGFSDAVEQLGATPEGDEPLDPRLTAVLRESAPKALTNTQSEPTDSKPKRKRLGRSLEQLRAPASSKSADKAA